MQGFFSREGGTHGTRSMETGPTATDVRVRTTSHTCERAGTEGGIYTSKDETLRRRPTIQTDAPRPRTERNHVVLFPPINGT